jgi:hypothetical protein
MTSPDPQLIATLEAIQLPASLKVDFLLVYLGQKPATNFCFTREFRHADRPPVRPDQAPFDDLIAWAKHTGLPHAVEVRTVNPARELFRGTFGEHLLRQLHAEGKNIDVPTEIAEAGEHDTITLYVGTDTAWLEKMRRADHEGNERLMGQCAGFTSTAIEAYITDDLLTREEQDALAPSAEVRAFDTYRVSRTSSAEDLQPAQHWATAVKAASPIIYHQILEI